MGSYSSALIPDAEEFNSVVSIVEQLDEQVTLMMEEKRKDNQSQESSTLQGSSEEMSQNGPVLPAAAASIVSTPSFSSLLPKALSAVLHPPNSEPKLEQLQAELRELRDQFEVMKSQHNKEIKLLMNELDEEKRVRLTLQMEIQRMKKHMSK